MDENNAVMAAPSDERQGKASSVTGKGGLSRRGFVFGTCGAAAMLALGCVKFTPSGEVCRPPGAQDEERFLGACVRCGKCLAVCPNGVIVPSHIEDGIVGMRSPKMDYSQATSRLGGKLGWCDHCDEANGGVARCAEVCPSGALSPDENSSFDTMRLGLAVIDHDLCLAWRLKGCTICKNACPLGAITFDGMNRPSVDESLCNGCGACEQACVSLESTSVGQGETSRDTSRRAVRVHPIAR